VYTNPEDRGLKSAGVSASQYRVNVTPAVAGIVVFETKPMSEEVLDTVEMKMVLFAVGHADRGVNVGVERTVVDADVVVVTNFAVVGLGPDGTIVRTPEGSCDVDDLVDMLVVTLTRPKVYIQVLITGHYLRVGGVRCITSYCTSHHRTDYNQNKHQCYEQKRSHLHSEDDSRRFVDIAVLLCVEA
jgi:hypothetical protein